MTKRTSIIIPVYKVEKTLDRCVSSVAGHHDDNIEIILVDDGSPDRCPTMCDAWAEKDRRITVVHKNNGGLSSARNTGIEKAQGKYLMFVDSDDFLEQDTIKTLTEIMDNNPEYDILEFPVCRICGNKKQNIFTPGRQTYDNMEDYWLKGKAYTHSYAWNKIYRRKMFDNVRYPEGLVFEDIHTLPELLKNASTVATTDKGMYCYCWNGNGITATAGANEWRTLLNAHMKMYEDMDCRNTDGQTYYMYILNIQIYTNELTGDPPLLRTMKIDIRKAERQFRIKAALLNIFGVKGLCTANRMIRNIIKR